MMTFEERAARIRHLKEQQKEISREINYLQAQENVERRGYIAEKYGIIENWPLRMTTDFVNSIIDLNDFKVVSKYRDKLYIHGVGLLIDESPGFTVDIRVGPIEQDGSRYLIESVRWRIVKDMMK